VDRPSTEPTRQGSAPRDPLLDDLAGSTEHLLGNDAIVRGALEAGVVFMAGYPGTPSSEITDGFARIAERKNIAFEYAVNEKIALELAFAASLAGARSLTAMKHLGLMVAGDPISTIPYVGVEAGMVIVSAGDPSCHTSPNEADQRHLGPMLHLPILDPSTPAEAHAMTREAFELSERCRLPVLLRTTTRVAHSRGAVKLGPLRSQRVGGFQKNPAKHVPVPANARRMRLEVKERLEAARKWMAESGFFQREGAGKRAVLASGAPAATTRDLLGLAGARGDVALWRLGCVFPLPEQALVEALREVETVLVVEELSPFLEDALFALLGRHRLSVEILGKRSGHLPEEFEYGADVIQRALFDAFGIGAPPRKRPALPMVPVRAPSLCPGCPHRAAFVAARSAFDEDQIYMNDIGCYTLGYAPPLSTADALLCMGAGFTLAAGVARVTGKRTVGFMGDSTFFHAGMPALLDSIKERANVVAVVLDNEITAMTGFQESPTRAERVEDVARALGARHVETIDPYEQDASIAAFRRARAATGTSVIVVRRACPVGAARAGTAGPRPESFVADPERCRTCGRSEHHLRCDVPVTEGFERNLARVASERGPLTLESSVAPCAERCPLSLCIQGYAGHIAAGENAEALRHVLARTPLPHSVCRVCDRPCEAGCVRSGLDEAVAINDLKRHVVDWAEAERPELLSTPRPEPNGLTVAVVGAGAAGLSAAHELAVRGYAVTLYDAEEQPGGLLTHGIPEYRLPADRTGRDIARVLELCVEFVGQRRLGENLSLSELEASHAAVFLAVGAHRPKTLGLPGSELPDAPARHTALGYLRASRRGEALPTARTVVVIGGGNAAVDAARTALRSGADSVTLACIEAPNAMPALPDEIVAAEHEGVRLTTGVRPLRFETGALVVGALEGGAETRLEADLVIFAIGQDPDPSALEGLALDASGLVTVDPLTAATSRPKVFAGGDVTAGERSVTRAMAWGLRAAWGIDAALRGREVADLRPPPAPPVRRPVVTAVAPELPRRSARELEPAERIASMREVNLGLSAADARAEAKRCLQCGLCGNCRACIEALGCPALAMNPTGEHVVVDPVWCIGCGVCADLCSNRAFGTPGTPCR
jgi:indolepyruvate ferredoxin oxidoreductase alpha subunit